MCELFGMSASGPTTAGTALAEFRLRGGQTADNPDGWGLACWGNGAFHLFKEPTPAYLSTRFARLCGTTRSKLILAHVRKARLPPVRALSNTHPFQQKCCGKEWVFAHNGLVPEIVAIERTSDNPVCRPMGETDSEHAFCHLLGHIARHFDRSPEADPAARFENLAAASGLVASLGKFNFLMSEGEYLIAYGHDRLHYLERPGSTGSDGAPVDWAMIATEPLDHAGQWTPFEAGELRVYRHGRMVGRVMTRALHPAAAPMQ